MRRARGMSPFKAGVIGIVGILLALWLSFGGIPHPFSDTYHLKAVFANPATTLNKNSPVRIAGVNVGKVTSIEKGPGNTALVEMDIEKAGLPIHKDATLKIRPRLFLEGNFFVEVRPGTPSAPELKSGDPVPLAQTATPVQVDEFLDTFATDTRTSLKQLLKGFADTADQGGDVAIRNTFKALGPASLSLAQTAEAAQGIRRDDLSKVIAEQGRFLAAIDSRNTQLRQLITSFNQTAGAFADRQSQLSATIRGLDSTVKTVRPTLASIDSASPPLRRFAESLQPALAIAPPILDHGSAFLKSTGTFLEPGRGGELVNRLSPTVSGLRKSERLLPPLMDLVRPVSVCLRDKGLPILKGSVVDGELTNGLPVWKELASMGVGLMASSGNYSGQGYTVRYSFGLAETAFATPAANLPDTFLLSDSPITGARPRWVRNSQPPFRPDVPCETQPVQSLDAEFIAANAPKKATLPKLTPARLESLLDKVADLAPLGAAKGGAR